MHCNLLIAAIIAGLAILSQVNGASNRIPLNHQYSEEDFFLIPSRVLFEFGTHVLQTGKIVAALGEGVLIDFPLGRSYTYDFTREVCSGNNSCEPVNEFITIGGMVEDYIPCTVLSGALDNDAKIAFDVTNFTYALKIADFKLVSSDFRRIVTKLNSGDRDAYSGLVLTVANSTIGISADFEFQGHYKVSNVKVLLNLGEVSMKIRSVSKFENGTWTDLPPIEKEAGQMVMELWRETDESGQTLETRYSQYFEEQINEVLAGRELLFA